MPIFHEYHTHQPETVILIHGGGLSSKQWTPNIDALQAFHVIVPDLPQHGENPTPFELATATREIADLLANHAHNGKAHLVGLSLGGALVLQLLHDHPDRVLSAFVTGTSGKIGGWLRRMMIMSAQLANLFSRRWLVDASIRMYGIEAHRDLVFDDLVRGMSPDLYTRMANALYALDLPLNNSVPLLLLVGDQETAAAKSAARTLHETIPNAQFALVPNANHIWNLQHPALFEAMVLKWISGQEI